MKLVDSKQSYCKTEVTVFTAPLRILRIYEYLSAAQLSVERVVLFSALSVCDFVCLSDVCLSTR